MSLKPVFDKTRKENRAAIIGYLPAGFPDMNTCVQAVRAMAEGGCDIIEVGVPFSDPVLDGPIIEAASRQALAQGVRIPQVLEIVSAVTDAGAAAVVMSYFNPLAQYGISRFTADLVHAGGQGVVTPDLIVDEADEWLPIAHQYHIDPIFLVAPLSTDERIKCTVSQCSGFVYAASVMGVTGVRQSLPSGTEQLVRRVRRYSDLPVCVGLGVKDGRQAAAIAQYADGVIVGSAFVTAVSKGVTAVTELTEELSRGVRYGIRCTLG